MFNSTKNMMLSWVQVKFYLYEIEFFIVFLSTHPNTLAHTLFLSLSVCISHRCTYMLRLRYENVFFFAFFFCISDVYVFVCVLFIVAVIKFFLFSSYFGLFVVVSPVSAASLPLVYWCSITTTLFSLIGFTS